ncbi:MAG TPA: Gfo/Idh/MocA family oxidoreductase, partial [Phototrophicaceae bacterium]|nr:Gfo/Idh/MocA family oxidoreductase [Phototrophicaceae bacterium]
MADKIRWGIISTANIARGAVIPAIKASRNGVVYAVASRDLSRARSFADELGIEHAYGSYEELLSDPNVDAVYNPLPNDGHAPWSIAAAKAKKPTLCEKPLALDAAEAWELVEAFRAEDVLLAEAFMYRYHPQHQTAKELIANGTLGKVSIITATFTYSMSFDEQVNVRLKPAMGGGGLL